MRISIVGSGYVGTTIAACFADAGHRVYAIDVDTSIVKAINAGDTPIHEPGLSDLLDRLGGNQLVASSDYADILESDVTFLAVPTPSRSDGSVDLSFVETAARSVGTVLREKGDRHVIVVKSTVVPGSTEGRIADSLTPRAGPNDIPDDLGLAVNPEFLREGTAVSDFQRPDKVVIGTEPEAGWVRSLLDGMYSSVYSDNTPPVLHTGIREAEMIKYANNAFLASKISLINDIGNICKLLDIDSYEVAHALGLDHRIEGAFLRSGVGWGGSCFGKDLAAIIAAASKKGYNPIMLQSAIEVNETQPVRMVNLLEEHVEIEGKKIAILGLAFKPGTDDIRDSRSIPVIRELVERGATVAAYDPVAIEPMRDQFPDIEYASSAAAALDGAHGGLILTDWDEFAALEGEFRSMADPIIIDGRRIVDPPSFVTYEGLTW